jgi:hypothetical protein
MCPRIMPCLVSKAYVSIDSTRCRSSTVHTILVPNHLQHCRQLSTSQSSIKIDTLAIKLARHIVKLELP